MESSGPPASLASIHFPRLDVSCRFDKAELTLPEALCCGELDDPGALCVAVGGVDGSVSVYKASLGPRVWTQVAGCGCVGALHAVRLAGWVRDVVVATTAGERFATVLDFGGGSVRRFRVEPLVEACCAAVRSDPRGRPGALRLALGSQAGTVALYDATVVEDGGGSVSVVAVQSWRVESDAPPDCVSFVGPDADRLCVSAAGAVYVVAVGGGVQCVRGAGASPCKTKPIKNSFIAISMDGAVRLFDQRNQTALEFCLEDSVVFAFKHSNLLREKRDEFAVVACTWQGQTWFIDELGNVLLFQPLDEAEAATRAVVAFDVHRLQGESSSTAVYLLSSGEIIFFSIDLTYLECRLFQRHAHRLVREHPFWGGLSTDKQRDQLVQLALNGAIDSA